jgi:Ca-activated chloride channel family protein
MIEFESPWAFLLLILVPVVGWYYFSGRKNAALRFSSIALFDQCKPSWRIRLMPIVPVIRMIALILLVIAIARPRKGTTISENYTEAVAIEMVVDRSGSMAEKIKYFGQNVTRLEAAKKVFEKFLIGDGDKLNGRAGDLVGLVTFARYADTTCPLVTGHDVLVGFLRQIGTVTVDKENYTAIGDAVALAAARLKKAEEQLDKNKAGEKEKLEIKSKVMILLTDGQDNASELAPMQAAKLAKEWGIKIYTIAIGSGQRAGVFGFQVGASVNEPLLKAIAESTGGFYAKADDSAGLVKIVEKIDSLEKTRVKAIEFVEYDEKFHYFAAGALGLLLLGALLESTVLRKIP